jgi:hypothetical protein
MQPIRDPQSVISPSTATAFGLIFAASGFVVLAIGGDV